MVIKFLLSSLVQLIYPPLCPSCGSDVSGYKGLCPDCWKNTFFFSGRGCRFCGAPIIGSSNSNRHYLPDDLDLNILDRSFLYDICEDCHYFSPPWLRGSSALLYCGSGKDLVLKMKHADRIDIVPILGDWMINVGRFLIDKSDWIVPVPLSKMRMIKRKYNQSALLAKYIAKNTDKNFAADALLRISRSNHKDRRDINARFEHVRGSIKMNNSWAKKLAGGNILLVDDVFVTGATLSACTVSLIEGGAKSVSVLTACRSALRFSELRACQDEMLITRKRQLIL